MTQYQFTVTQYLQPNSIVWYLSTYYCGSSNSHAAVIVVSLVYSQNLCTGTIEKLGGSDDLQKILMGEIQQ